jgi:hypothetical protein
MRTEAQGWCFCATDFLRAAGMPETRSSMTKGWISTAHAKEQARVRTWLCTLLFDGLSEGHRGGRYVVATLPAFCFTLGLVPDV